MNIWQIQQDLLDIFNELEENGGELTPELEEKRREFEQQRTKYVNEDHDLWGDIDNTFAIADEYKTPEQKREEFLQKYRNRSGGASALPEDKKGKN